MEHINKSGSVVNIERLRWINSRHIRSLFDEIDKKQIVDIVAPHLKNHLGQGNTSKVDQCDEVYIWKAAWLMKVSCAHI